MFGFLKKLFGLGSVEQNTTDPIVKLGPEPTAETVEQRPEVAVSAQAAWPFPTKMPEQGKGKKKPTTKKKSAPTKKAAPVQKQPAPAPTKKKPAAMTPAPKKKKKPAAK